MDRIAVRRALVSVWDKTGIVELARGLKESEVELVSSGGTAGALREAGLEVVDVADLTGFPEMLDGRVKTLHPRIHAGILADRSSAEHLETLRQHGIGTVDLVVVNLYPFDALVDDSTAEADAVELIDVGGPSMVRGAAKNFGSVAVVVDPGDYPMIAVEIRSGGITLSTRRRLAAKAFRRLAAYDAAVAAWLSGADVLPERITIAGQRVGILRYGENPHQASAVYRTGGPAARGVASGEQLQGKELSFINYLDLDAAFKLCTAFAEPAACIIKHTSPCGAAVADGIEEAYRLAFECDPRSAFGGIVGLNRPVSLQVAEQMREVFLECIVAPGFEPGALELFSQKKNLRLIRLPEDRWTADPVEVRGISGGLLVQTPDRLTESREGMRVVTQRQPSDAEWEDLLFAWTVCAHVKSNAIVLANLKRAVGVGAGQMSRVEAMEIAVRRAGDRAKGSVAASEALMPFADNVEVAAAAGVTAVIQPGGAVRDDELVAAADAAGIAMVFTGVRHFWH